MTQKNKPEIWRTGDIFSIAKRITKDGDWAIEVTFKCQGNEYLRAWLTIGKTPADIWSGWVKVIDTPNSGMEGAIAELTSESAYNHIGKRVSLCCVEDTYKGRTSLKVKSVDVYDNAPPADVVVEEGGQSGPY